MKQNESLFSSLKESRLHTVPFLTSSAIRSVNIHPTLCSPRIRASSSTSSCLGSGNKDTVSLVVSWGEEGGRLESCFTWIHGIEIKPENVLVAVRRSRRQRLWCREARQSLSHTSRTGNRRVGVQWCASSSKNVLPDSRSRTSRCQRDDTVDDSTLSRSVDIYCIYHEAMADDLCSLFLCGN